jgi:hypothetical protein
VHGTNETSSLCNRAAIWNNNSWGSVTAIVVRSGEIFEWKDPNVGNKIQSENKNDRKGKRIKDKRERKSRKSHKRLGVVSTERYR